MEFTQYTIKQIELAMGFKLYKWQEHYLLNDFNINHNYRCAGNTTIYAIKKLLTLKEVIDINSNNIGKLIDYNPSGRMALNIFREELKEINEKLVAVGFVTCLKTNEEPFFEMKMNHRLSKCSINVNGKEWDTTGIDYIVLDNGPLIVLNKEKYSLIKKEEGTTRRHNIFR